MGHLVNARSFRLGWNLNWSDVWYRPHYDYASFIFICARQRAILRMLFYSKVMDKSPYIFSHFEIEKLCKHLFVKIYFYFIPFNSLMTRLSKGIWRTMRRWKRKHYSYPRDHLHAVIKSDSYRNWWNKRKLRTDYRRLSRLSYLDEFGYKKHIFPFVKKSYIKKFLIVFKKRSLFLKDTWYEQEHSSNVYNHIREIGNYWYKWKKLPRLLRNRTYGEKVSRRNFIKSLSSETKLPFDGNLKKQRRDQCIWLYFDPAHTDTSILRSAGLNLNSNITYGNRLLKFLIKILNRRERFLDYVIDGVRGKGNKFSVNSFEFLDSF